MQRGQVYLTVGSAKSWYLTGLHQPKFNSSAQGRVRLMSLERGNHGESVGTIRQITAVKVNTSTKVSFR
jgi:hypothetical protein